MPSGSLPTRLTPNQQAMFDAIRAFVIRMEIEKKAQKKNKPVKAASKKGA